MENRGLHYATTRYVVDLVSAIVLRGENLLRMGLIGIIAVISTIWSEQCLLVECIVYACITNV